MVKHQDVTVQLTGQDGNAFVIIGRVASALRYQVSTEASEEFVTAAFACKSYDALLALTQRTVHVH